MSRSFSGFKHAISQSSCLQLLQLGSKPTELAPLPYRRNAAVLSCNQNQFLLFLILLLTNEFQQDATIYRYLFSVKLIYMFRTSIPVIIRSTWNCSCSLWYRSYYLGSKLPQTWPNKDLFGHVCPDVGPYLVMSEEACSPYSMICTRGCNYSFMYSWWWVRWTPETCSVI